MLERADDDDRVVQAFTPDFFLPELGIYIECTAMRPCLTRPTRRKVERARHLHGVTVEVLFRADAERLAERWGVPGLRAAVEPGELAA